MNVLRAAGTATAIAALCLLAPRAFAQTDGLQAAPRDRDAAWRAVTAWFDAGQARDAAATAALARGFADDDGVYPAAWSYYDFEHGTFHDACGDWRDVYRVAGRRLSPSPRDGSRRRTPPVEASGRATRTADEGDEDEELHGTIEAVRTFELRDGARRMAILDAGAARWLLDLGPADDAPAHAQVERGAHVAIHGTPTEKGGRTVLLVHSLQRDGSRDTTKRPARSVATR